jgi:hypothetical protein
VQEHEPARSEQDQEWKLRNWQSLYHNTIKR